VVLVEQSLPAPPVPVALTVSVLVPVEVPPAVLIVSKLNWFPVEVPVRVVGAKPAVAPAGSPDTESVTVQLPLPLNLTCTEFDAMVP
jgi:hypothetical protein